MQPTPLPALHCRALLFDLDGVLVDSTECVERTWRAWAATRGIDGDTVVAYAHGRRATETVAHVAPNLVPLDELVTLAESEATESRGVYPIDGAAALVAQLPSERWAIVTSGVRSVATFRIGLGELPSPLVLITADDVTRGKPDPEGYLRAATALGVDPSECIVIEDAPAGIAAARAAGMQAIGISGTFPADRLHEAAFVVRGVADLAVELHGADIIIRAAP